LLGKKPFPSSFSPICGVSNYWMIYGRAVDANLVSPSSLQIDFKEGHTGKCLFDLPAGLSGPTSTALCGHLFSICWMTPYVEVDHPCWCVHFPINQSKIHFMDLPHLELAAQAFVGQVILCYNHRTGGLLVKAMDNAWPNSTANRFKTGTVKEQRVRKGLALVSSPRMNHKARGFVQNDYVSVFVQNGKGNRLRLTFDGLRGRDFRSDDIPYPG